jgi:hypothetical protein
MAGEIDIPLVDPQETEIYRMQPCGYGVYILYSTHSCLPMLNSRARLGIIRALHSTYRLRSLTIGTFMQSNNPRYLNEE